MNLIELSKDNFDTIVNKSDIPVLVDFWAPWCGPCKAIAPILEDLAKEMGESLKVCKVNVDENSELAAQFNVASIPTIYLFENGNITKTSIGMIGSKEDLKTKLDLS